MALAWVVLAVLLLLVEMRHVAFFALFGAVGAFAAAAVAVVWPALVPLQLVVAVTVATVGIIAVRPRLSSSFHRHDDHRLGRGVHGSLIGEEVSTLDTVSPHDVGHVSLAGERWLAVSGSDEIIPAHTRVLVTGVDGTTLIVWPVEGAGSVVGPGGATEPVGPAGPAIGDLPAAPPPGTEGGEIPGAQGEHQARPAPERNQGEPS